MMKLSSKQQLLGGLVVLLVIALFIALFVGRGNDNESAESLTENTEEQMEEAEGTTDDTSAAPAVKTVSGGCAPSLSISKNDQLRALVLKWNACSKDNFQLYTIYRNGAVIDKSSDKNLANYVDKNLVSGTTYTYKVCVSQAPEIFTCSNTVSSTF